MRASRASLASILASSMLALAASAVTSAHAQEPAASGAASPSSSSSSSPSAETTVLSLPDLAARITPSVLLLHLFDDGGRERGTGTGFFVGSDGRLVTNFHVIRRATKMTATLSDGRDIQILGVLATDEDNDLALLRAEGGGYPALSLAGSSTARIGQDIVVIGSPHGLSASLSTGVISAIRERGIHQDGDHDIMTASWSVQVTAAGAPGSSGSPVLGRDGNVIAIIVGSYANESGIAFAIRAELARQLVEGVAADAIARPFVEPTTAREIVRNIVISVAAFGLLLLAFVLVPRLVRRNQRKKASASLRRLR